MTIAGWACPHCKKNVPLDHYATTKCGLHIHPAYAAAILHDEAVDPHGEAMSVTDGLSCPRLRAMENQEPLFVNPLDYNAMLLGHAWDATVGAVAIQAWLQDSNFRAKVPLVGTIAGMPLTGELDNIRRLDDMLIISDWKHSNNLRAFWIAKEGGPSTEYKVQTSIYAELYRQMFGETPTHGEIVYHFSGAGQPYLGGELKSKFTSPPLMPFQYPIMPIEECLAYRPYGGQRTVQELYQIVSTVYGNNAVDWQLVPPIGMEMSFGSKAYCDYCQAKDTCMTQVRGAPF